jgi:hypothetical protein
MGGACSTYETEEGIHRVLEWKFEREITLKAQAQMGE